MDFDDTIVKSSEEIIRQLNKKYKLERTISDLKDWGYKSIYSKLTQNEVLDMYDSTDFFAHVKFNDYFLEFKEKFLDTGVYYPIICSKGRKLNLNYKRQFCDMLFQEIKYDYIGIEFEDNNCHLDKSKYDFSNTYFAIDDNTKALLSLSSPKKILLKNNREQIWNYNPINQENLYIVNNFKDIIKMCEFDENLEEKGIILG